MKLLEFASNRQWTPIAGYVIYIAALTAGYYYNLTFIQLGLTDLGTREIGMAPEEVSIVMAILALLTLVVAIISGVVIDQKGWSTDLYTKFRLLFLIILVQLGLTIASPFISTTEAFIGWIVICSLTLGVGIPVTFSFMIDFIPVRDRGYVAAIVAGLSFFVAALYPIEWQIEQFSLVMSAMMIPGVLILGVLLMKQFAFVDALAKQHKQEDFSIGRFCRPVPVRTFSFALLAPIILMFGVFFIDSLGFLRIIEEPIYIYTSWQSPDLNVRMFIAVMHVVGALVGGLLYTSFGRNWLFFWVFCLFALTHLLYVFDIRFGTDDTPALLLPMFYVLAVSFYTTLNFALWPDLSTPETIGIHTALGVGIAGWLATFMSTALALYSEGIGIPLGTHLIYVNALSLLFVAGLPILLYIHRMFVLAKTGVLS